MKKFCKVIVVASTFCALHCEQPNEFQPLPPGAFFSFTNNNSQSLNIEETKREVHVEVKHPPYSMQHHNVSNNPPQPRYAEPIHTNYAKNENPTGSLYGSVSYYASAFETQTPHIFTLKNAAYIIGFAALSYGIVWIKLLKHVKNATKSNGWGSFQEHIPPNHLSTIAQLVLADGIIEEIKSRYPLLNPANLMPSLLLFNKDVEQELEELTAFVTFYTWLIKYKLAALFPDQKKLLAKAQTKIQRLHILQDAISEWINTHVTRLMRNQPVPRQETHVNFACTQ